MSRLFLVVLLIYVVSINESCIIKEKKAKPDIQVIELDDSSSDSSEEIVGLHVSDRRRREIDSQERSGSCETDEDCGPGKICLKYLNCVKGKWLNLDSLEMFSKKSYQHGKGDNDAAVPSTSPAPLI